MMSEKTQMLSGAEERFWQAYLGQAYDLWFLLQADNPQRSSSWTRPKRYRYRHLARLLGCGFSTIKGGLRPCNHFEKSKQRGEPLTECCGRYHPVKWDHVTTEDNHQCWTPGLMERLYSEGLLAVEEEGDYRKPNTHVLRLQVWTMLPLLTPKQVRTLGRGYQAEYKRWLKDIARKTDFDVEAWEALTEETFVTKMDGYDCGRILFDIYQPNSLLAGNDVIGHMGPNRRE